jgi:hypothetical protein
MRSFSDGTPLDRKTVARRFAPLDERVKDIVGMILFYVVILLISR